MLVTRRALDQELWTRSGRTLDVQMDEGICFALCHEWCMAHAKRDVATLATFFSRNMPNMHRLFSFQRGFNLVSDSLGLGANYDNYHSVDESLTTNMITNDASRNGVRVEVVMRTQAGGMMLNTLNECAQGETLLIGFWGVDQSDQSNWGHVVAVAWPPHSPHPYYFDPNSGLHEEQVNTTLATDVFMDLHDM